LQKGKPLIHWVQQHIFKYKINKQIINVNCKQKQDFLDPQNFKLLGKIQSFQFQKVRNLTSQNCCSQKKLVFFTFQIQILFEAMGRSSKDKRDVYYRLAKEEGWRAR